MPEEQPRAELYGYEVVTPAAVVSTTCKRSRGAMAHELLTRDATKQLVDQLKQASPTVVEELIREP